MSFIEYSHASPAQQIARILDKLGCSEADLNDNRKGRLSDAQMRKLFAAEVMFPMVTVVLLAIALAAIMVAQNTLVPEGEKPPTALQLGRVAVVIGLLIQTLRVPWRLVRDMATGKVSVAQGRPTHKVTEKKIKIDGAKETMPFDSYEIGGIEIPIKSYLLDVIDDVNPYNFYYTPLSKHLVCAEPYVAGQDRTVGA